MSTLVQGHIPHKKKWAWFKCPKPGGEAKGSFPFRSQPLHIRVINGLGYVCEDVAMVEAQEYRQEVMADSLLYGPGTL